MNHKRPKRGVLLKTGISRDILISEFISGMLLSDIGKKYKRTSERIWQIIRKGCSDNEYAQFAEQHKKSRKAVKLSKFIAYAAELERVPLLHEVKEHCKELQIHYREFRKVAEANGFAYTAGNYRRGRTRKHTADQLLEYIKELASRLGHTPSCNDINREEKFTHNMYVTAFGSLQKAQQLAGLPPNNRYNSLENARRNSKYITREHCIEDLKRIHDELGGHPTVKQLKKHGKYPFSKYYSRIGGIKEIRILPELNTELAYPLL